MRKTLNDKKLWLENKPKKKYCKVCLSIQNSTLYRCLRTTLWHCYFSICNYLFVTSDILTVGFLKLLRSKRKNNQLGIELFKQCCIWNRKKWWQQSAIMQITTGNGIFLKHVLIIHFMKACNQCSFKKPYLK